MKVVTRADFERVRDAWKACEQTADRCKAEHDRFLTLSEPLWRAGQQDAVREAGAQEAARLRLMQVNALSRLDEAARAFLGEGRRTDESEVAFLGRLLHLIGDPARMRAVQRSHAIKFRP